MLVVPLSIKLLTVEETLLVIPLVIQALVLAVTHVLLQIKLLIALLVINVMPQVTLGLVHVYLMVVLPQTRQLFVQDTLLVTQQPIQAKVLAMILVPLVLTQQNVLPHSLNVITMYANNVLLMLTVQTN